MFAQESFTRQFGDIAEPAAVAFHHLITIFPMPQMTAAVEASGAGDDGRMVWEHGHEGRTIRPVVRKQYGSVKGSTDPLGIQLLVGANSKEDPSQDGASLGVRVRRFAKGSISSSKKLPLSALWASG